MKAKKRSILYDPNLICACSVDLREAQNQLPKVKLDTEIKSENVLPPNSKIDLDNQEQSKIN